jgi:NADPH-dependent F420 reductase
VRVAVVGGTGEEGFGLALRWARAGHHVTIGSRMQDKADASAEEARAILGEAASVAGGTNADAAAGAEVTVVTVPFTGMAPIYGSIHDALPDGAIVCDCTSPLMAGVGGRPTHALRPWQGSAAEFAQTLLPDHVRLVAGFHTIAAATLRAVEHDVDSDVLIVGADLEAKGVVGSLAEDVPGMRWVDAGPLAMARITESLTPLLIGINGRYKVHDAGFRISGEGSWGAPGAPAG